jgi:transcriptional regulator with GAF, ATPase, and Fis domain
VPTDLGRIGGTCDGWGGGLCEASWPPRDVVACSSMDTPVAAPKFEALKCLLLKLGGEREACALLKLIVEGLAELPHIALARVWLLQPGDLCPTCPRRPECPSQVECLQLVASAGKPREKGADWSRIDGGFSRFPIGVRKVGEVARSKDAVCVRVEGDATWLARPEWAEAEGVQGFAGQPLMYEGELLGVLGVFSRYPPQREGLDWLRMLADHAASAIVNARAFEEIEHLKASLELERDYLREETRSAQSFGQIIGDSAALRALLRQIELVAPTDANVLILGESGTGKELVAREIHSRSSRSAKPMVRVNCASIPRELFESEFFGHVRGAFTGAIKDRAGRFALADGGTLFLDEVGEIPLELQSKLLRVLQEGEFERIGEAKTHIADVRIVAATNRDLREEADAGRFREDLYYRLNVFPVEVSPLRKRAEDVPALARHFLGLAAKKLKLPLPRLTQAAVLRMQSYAWPGNVRELQNVIERAVIISQGGALELNLPEYAVKGGAAAESADEAFVSLEEVERRHVVAVLSACDWVIEGEKGAAKILGLHPNTLRSRMKKKGIERPSE